MNGQTIVTVIQDNVVQHMYTFNDNTDAESAFADLVAYYDDKEPNPDELNDALDDGLWEMREATVTIGQPEDGTRKDTHLHAIREIINEPLTLLTN